MAYSLTIDLRLYVVVGESFTRTLRSYSGDLGPVSREWLKCGRLIVYSNDSKLTVSEGRRQGRGWLVSISQLHIPGG